MKHDKAITYDKKAQILTLCKGVLIAYALSCIAFIGCALALTYTNMNEGSIPLIVTISCVVSVVVAGFDAAKGANDKGWLWGLVAGLVYAIILMCIGVWISTDFKIDLRTITLFALCITGGGLGGVIGINFKK